ncbi:hypothetical protein [Microbacterium sp. B24]|uniref:hypothetical protein n=1 Tax=Microbacterium sp. B24 TaxID=95616 RepID=UPI000422E667|nr:hypothetical protein [Microbacterium sp. B24]
MSAAHGVLLSHASRDSCGDDLVLPAPSLAAAEAQLAAIRRVQPGATGVVMHRGPDGWRTAEGLTVAGYLTRF